MTRSHLLGHLAAVAASAVAVLLALVLVPVLEVSPFPILLAAVTLSAWRGGMGPGLVATVVGVAALDFLFFQPTFTLVVHYASDAINLAVFALVALLISSLNARLRTALQRADLARAEAERLAAERAAIITARHELERQRDEFLANVSHDLRTPLTAIKHSIEVILHNEPPRTPTPIHDLFVNIDQATARMAALVDDLLALSRLRAGKVRLRTAPCDLAELAVRAAHVVEPLAAARGQRVELDLPPEPVPVEADAERLERALLNLLGNAQKYGRPEGTIRVSVGHHDGQAHVAVADDGPGIPAAEHERIFDRFYRSESEATRATQGHGLGLPIARALVELHGGRLWVESTPGRGSTFHVALPLAPALVREAVLA
jgi:signal transduction histidine kinase